MSGRAVFVYSDAYLGYRFGPGHPFDPVRLRRTMQVLLGLGLVNSAEIEPPRPATRAQLLRVHAEDYVDAVERMSQTGAPVQGAERYGLGTVDDPVFPGMHDAAALAVGGSILAAEVVANGRALHAMNIGGGLHHAHHRMAAGFCIYNDIVAAIQTLRDRNLRVAYVDIDAHHGDGVEEAFYLDPDVLTISFHESGRYLFPGTGAADDIGVGAGRGTTINVPLEPFTGDGSWLELFDAVVPKALRAFGPDAIVSQHGCDGHFYDPLADLTATTRLYAATAATLHRLAHELSAGRWVALGGGGYDTLRVVPRAWPIVWAEMRGTPIAEGAELPEAFLAAEQTRDVDIPRLILDPPDAFAAVREAQVDAASRNRETLDELMRGSPLLRS